MVSIAKERTVVHWCTNCTKMSAPAPLLPGHRRADPLLYIGGQGYDRGADNPTNRVAKNAPVWFGLVHPLVARIACSTPAVKINLLRDRVTQVWTAQEAPEVRHICRGFRRQLEAVAAAQGVYINL